MVIVVAFIVGLVFGIGLLVSGMANPAKVLGFLDITGAWDPSLALVMAGAVIVGLFAFAYAAQRERSLLGLPMRLPRAAAIDGRLLAGSAIFGIGWGLVGFCPGPALVALGTGTPKAVAFVVALLAGMALFDVVERARGVTPERAEGM